MLNEIIEFVLNSKLSSLLARFNSNSHVIEKQITKIHKKKIHNLARNLSGFTLFS